MSEVAIKVAVRVRPFSRREMEQNQKTIIRVLDSSTLIFDPEEDEDEFFFHGSKQTHRDITKRVKKKLSMEYDNVLCDETSNEQVFEICTKPIVASVMNGFNCSVFVYGATGAGKTFTMLGSENNPGITFLTMRELFTQIDQLSDERKFDIGISYLEVYNELVMNLLTKSGPLKLREDANGVVVGGLVLKQIHNAEELFELLVIGNKNRTQHPTDANEESSRSHAIFQVHIRMTDKKTSVRRTVKLSMIDLAGSERAQSTKCKGLRFKEGANINKSLLALGNCINKLADGCKHIPYRDSNLTRILKDSLGGNCQTLMIANVSPSSLTYEDTYNTLKYASRAKKIRTMLRQNVITTNMPKEFLLKKCNDQVSLIDKFKAEIEKLKERNKMLESQLTDQKIVAFKFNGAGDSASKASEVDLSSLYAKIDAVYNNYNKAHEMCLSLQSSEKILSFKIGFKKKYEDLRSSLKVDGVRLNADISRLTASIDKYSEEASRIKNGDSARWIKRYKEASRDMNHLKDEISQMDMSEVLTNYINTKNYEHEKIKMLMKMSHSSKINSVYQSETNNFYNIALKSLSVIQSNFYLLHSMGEIDSGMMNDLLSLERMTMNQRSVKFADEEPAAVLTSSNSSTEVPDTLNINNIMNITDYACDVSPRPMLTKKRPKDDDDVEKDSKKMRKFDSDFQFLRPKAVQSINFDAASSLKVPSKINGDQDMNMTFEVEVPKVLSERSNKAPSITPSIVSAAGKAFKQPKSAGATAKYTLNINKENKKFSPNSNRVKKAARTPNRVAGGKDFRPKLVKSAVASSLVLVQGKDKLKAIKKV